MFHLSILPEPQQAWWPKLEQVPKRFVLYGGTAIALRLAHRKSIDFDFFTSDNFNSDQLVREMNFLAGAKHIQESPNILTVLKWIEGFDKPIRLSFFGGLRLGQIKSPDAANNGIFVASMLDLFGMKCATVIQRAEAKDYVDIYTIINNTDLTLEHGLGAARAIYGQQYNAVLTLKALSFFNDGNVKLLPDRMKRELSDRVVKCNLDNVPNFLPTTLIGNLSDKGTLI